MMQLNEKFGIRYFFGADDNFFNNKARTLEISSTAEYHRDTTTKSDGNCPGASAAATGGTW
jgi:hypothetical protein